MIKNPKKWLEIVKLRKKGLLDACIQASSLAILGENDRALDTEIGVYLTLQSGDIDIISQFQNITLPSVREGDALCIFHCPAWNPLDEYDIAKNMLSANTKRETFEEFKQNKIIYMAESAVEDTIIMLQREIQEQKKDREMQEYLDAHAQAHQAQYYEELKKEVTAGSEKDLQGLCEECEKKGDEWERQDSQELMEEGPFL